MIVLLGYVGMYCCGILQLHGVIVRYTSFPNTPIISPYHIIFERTPVIHGEYIGLFSLVLLHVLYKLFVNFFSWIQYSPEIGVT